MTISEWLNGNCAKMYAALVKEFVPRGFRSHIFLLRVLGLWPSADASRWYKYLTIAYFSFVGIVFPLSQLVNMFFVHTILQAMDSMFISFASWATTCKAAVIYWRRDHIRQLFCLNANIAHNGNSGMAQRATHTNINVQIILAALYLVTWFFGVIQSVVVKRVNAMLPSTAHWPYDIVHEGNVYWPGLVLQSVTSGVFIVSVATMDAFYIASITMTCGHIAQLKERLRNLGTVDVRGDNSELRFYKDFIDCCHRYENCLR